MKSLFLEEGSRYRVKRSSRQALGIEKRRRNAVSALILVSHGSTTQRPNPTLSNICRSLRVRMPFNHVCLAYLGPKLPNLEDQMRRLKGVGVRRIVVLPYFLHEGFHVSEELPRLIRRFRRRWPDIHIRRTAFLGSHPALGDVCTELMEGLVG